MNRKKNNPAQLRIALAQINSVVGDLSGNARKIGEYIQKAQKQKADLVIFPELAVTGYPPEDLLFKRHFISGNLSALERIKKCAADITVVAGFAARDRRGNVYNAAAVMRRRQITGVYYKHALPNYGVFDEKRYFQPGTKAPVFKLGEIVFGVNICEDIWVEPSAALEQARAGAGLLVNISASPFHMDKGRARRNVICAAARRARACVCYVNLVGGQDELVFDGGSFAVDSRGEELARAHQFQEDLIVFDMTLGRRRRVLREEPIDLGSLSPGEKPSLPRLRRPGLSRTEEIYRALVLGTRDYVLKNGFKCVVLGLSGGIDSALTAAIARDAVGRENVTGVSMPSRYSAKETRLDAEKLAANLGIGFVTVPIEKVFCAYLESLREIFSRRPADITEENLQARIRGNILMALSNKFNRLVLTTGNKSETSVGYCTLYGDMAGGFAVLKDVPKMLVYALARFVNEREGAEVIPRTTIARAPTAELKFRQKDQDSLPPYPLLDAVIEKYVEDDLSAAQIIRALGCNPDVVREIIERIDRNEYKRRQAPPGVKITAKAFGRDRRIPITNQYRFRQKT